MIFTSGRAEVPLDRRPASEVVQYLGGLRAFFVKRVAPCDVDDMVQEVVLRMQARRGETGIGNFEGYLFQVAHSVLTDRGRRDQARQRSRHGPLEEPDHPIEEISPARVLEGKQQLALLIMAMKELPDRTRQIFVLHRFEEMSYGGIARHMGISVSAVEKHIMKAIRHLTARAGE